MKYIELTKNKQALVDDVDYAWLNKLKWHLSSNGYAVTTTHNYVNDVRKTQHPPMHSLVNKTPTGKSTDHINENKLDNRRNNLRTCTQSQNMANRSYQTNNKSGYKGVYWYAGRWTAQIRVRGKTIHLGRTTDRQEAARMYSEAAVHYFGEFAKY